MFVFVITITPYASKRCLQHDQQNVKLLQMHRLFVSYNACGKTYATYKMLRIPRPDKTKR